jgi:hypothetical protein
LDSCGFDKEDELRVRSFRQKLVPEHFHRLSQMRERLVKMARVISARHKMTSTCPSSSYVESLPMKEDR